MILFSERLLQIWSRPYLGTPRGAARFPPTEKIVTSTKSSSIRDESRRDGSTLTLEGQLVDVVGGTIAPRRVVVAAGQVQGIEVISSAPPLYILPGFVDAHVHVESSMLIPSEFARLAVVHGTVGTVSDPHEIANVCGVDGVRFMLESGSKVPFKFCFGAPSCVPATSFETAGATLGLREVEELLDDPRIGYLSEMMNFPGVLNRDPLVMAKIAAAAQRGKPVDGHAPGLRGAAAQQYYSAGITTDHECFTREEAEEKLRLGMKILIREGSAARNFDTLVPLLRDYPDRMMFCSDDKHPDDLIVGHVNKLVARAVAAGIDPLVAIRSATFNPIRHYGLDIGLLQEGDPADFVIVEDLVDFSVMQTFIDGQLVAERGKSLIERVPAVAINRFASSRIRPEQLQLRSEGDELRVIEVYDGQIVTGEGRADPLVRAGFVSSDPDRDLLKLVVVNRYAASAPAVAFVHSFGLKRGAIASSVAHDSHNIVSVGVGDDDIASAINAVMEQRGGLSVALGAESKVLPLPVAGLMSLDDGYKVAQDYQALDEFARKLGTTLRSPFMTLSFLALLVIPKLKLSDKGLFDGERFEFVSVFR